MNISDKGVRTYYRCYNRATGIKQCNMKYIKAPDIENSVWEEIVKLIKNPGLLDTYFGKVSENVDKDKTETALTAARKKYMSLIDEEDRIISAYRKSIITEKQLSTSIKNLTDEKNTLQNKITALERLLINDEEIQERINLLKKHLEEKGPLLDKLAFTEKYLLVQLLIRKVIVYSKGSISIIFRLPETGEYGNSKIQNKTNDITYCLTKEFHVSRWDTLFSSHLNKKKNRTIRVHCTPEQIKALHGIAKETKKKVSNLLRENFDNYLSAAKKKIHGLSLLNSMVKQRGRKYYKEVFFNLTTSQIKSLVELSKETGISISEIVRLLVSEVR